MSFNKIKIEWALSKKLLDELESRGEIYFVGGFVRDMLIGIERTDQDILVIGIEPDELVKILQKYGFADWVGKSFSVIKFHCDGQIYDISIPSKRTNSIPDEKILLVDDLSSRDFTINSIAYNIETGELIDPTNGIKDIESKILRSTDEHGFENDPLRLLRLCRLRAKLNFDIEPQTFDIAKNSVSKISNIPPERIGEEFTKIMKLDKPSSAFRCMQQLGIIDIIIPELAECVGITQPGGMHAYDVFGHILHAIDESPPNLLVRFAAMFHDITKPQHRELAEDGRAKFYNHQMSAAKVAKRWLEKYAFSKKFTDDAAKLVRYHMFTHAETDKGVRRFIRKVGEQLLSAIFELRFADTKAQGLGGDMDAEMRYYVRTMKILSEKPPLSEKALAVNGNDIMNILQIPPGPNIGKILKKLLEIVIDDPSKNERETLVEIIRTLK
ncbi:HD domain-containing protein [bacterium]|nr:HD domain-containing protein [bacterium]